MTNDNTAEQLKPCPFCGGSADLEYTSPAEIRGDLIYTAWIQCRECGASSESIQQEESQLDKIVIISAWNTRADSGEAVAIGFVAEDGCYGVMATGGMYKMPPGQYKLYANPPRATADEVRDALQVIMEYRQLLETTKQFARMEQVQNVASNLEATLAKRGESK
jgi:Lar family restriction alleviation protein